jgi:acyl dehydratase
LALFAGASNDHVRLHIDSDFARAAGMEDVFAHGMLIMAYLAQALARWAPQDKLRHWNVRFIAITPLHATICCRCEVLEILHERGELIARTGIGVWTDKGIQTVLGEAFIAIKECA